MRTERMVCDPNDVTFVHAYDRKDHSRSVHDESTLPSRSDLVELLQKLASLQTRSICENSSRCADVNYADYTQWCQLVENDFVKEVLNSKLYMQLVHNAVGSFNFSTADPDAPHVAKTDIIAYVVRWLWATYKQYQLTLYHFYDDARSLKKSPTSKASLDFDELETFIHDFLEETLMLPANKVNPRLKSNSVKRMYGLYIVTGITFFLDPLKIGRIPVQRLFSGEVVQQLFALAEGSLDSDGNENSNESNVFSFHYFWRAYRWFVALDTNRDGLLTATDLRYFDKHQFTGLFLRQLEKAVGLKTSDLAPFNFDFVAFLQLWFALMERTSYASLYFFFSILDLKEEGVLSAPTVATWYASVTAEISKADELSRMPEEQVLLAEIGDIYGICGWQQTCQAKITMDEFCRAATMSQWVIDMLVDVDGFYRYEQRELVLQQPATS